MTAIFISHRSSDNAEADALRSWLGQQGHEQLFLDFDPADGIPAGVDWEQRLYQELRRCQALLIVLTPAWLESKWCGNELAIAREKGKAVFVVRVAACGGGPIIPAIQEVDLTIDRGAGLTKLARGLKEHGLDPASAFDWRPGRPIYPGLAAFDVDDAAIFFGRSEESWQAVEALRRLRLQATGSPKLLLITGASGSGKSSLMRAGALARLRKEPLSWIVAKPFRRGGDALGALAEAIAWAFPANRRPTSLEAITARLTGADGPGQLLLLARELRLALERPDGTLILALDQAEEALAAEQADDATRLLDLFRGTLARVGNEILVLATIRSDRLGGWQQHASIKATAEHGELPFEMLPLGPMPMARVSEIVRGPAAYEGLHVDDDLVDTIRADTPTADALPLLAYTLQYLHRHFAADGRLSLNEYRSFGGLEGSVRSQADAVIPIERLSEEERSALQEAFVPGLVRATAEGGFSRSRALLAALPARAETHLRRMVDDARLLLTDRDAEGAVTIEVAHEALLRVWPTLTRWIDADALNLRRLEALQRAAADWEQNGCGEDFLIHRDHRLSDAEALSAEPRFGGRLGTVDRDYLNISRAQQNSREAEERAAQERELRAAQKLAEEQKAKTQRTRIGLAVACVLMVVAVVFAGVAEWQRREAATLKDEAKRQANAAELARSEAVKQELEAKHQLDNVNKALATGLWNDLDFESEGMLIPAERKALWTLAVDGGLVRKRFVDELSTDTERMKRFTRNPEPVARALGLDWPSPQQAGEALGPVLDAIMRTTDPTQLQVLAQTVQMLAPKLDAEQAGDALGRVLHALVGAADRDQYEALVQVVQSLAPPLTAEQAHDALGPVLEGLKGGTNAGQPEALAQAVQALAPRLTAEQARDALGPVLDALKRETDSGQYHGPVAALAQTMQALAPSLTAEQSGQALSPLLDALKSRTTDPDALKALAQAIRALKVPLTPEQAREAQGAIFATFSNSRSQLTLAEAVRALPVPLADEQAKLALVAVVETIRISMAPGRHVGLREKMQDLETAARAAQALAVPLTTEHARDMLGPALHAITDTTEAADLQALASALHALTVSFTAGQAGMALDQVLDAIMGTTDNGQHDALIPAVRELIGKLTAEQARDELGPVLDAFIDATDQTISKTLANTLMALVASRTAEQARDALAPALTVLAINADTEHLQPLVQALPTPLTAKQAQGAAAPVLAALSRETSPHQLQVLAQTVRTLPTPLTAEQEQAALASILKALAGTDDPRDIETLALAVQMLGVPLGAEQGQAALIHVLAAVSRENYSANLFALSHATQMLGVPLSAEQGQAALSQILDTIGRTHNPPEVKALAQTIRNLEVPLTAEQGKAALGPALNGLSHDTGKTSRSMYLEMVKVLAVPLTPEQVRDVVAPVLAALAGTTDPGRIRDLTQATDELGLPLSTEQIREALAIARPGLAWASTPDEAAAWAEALVTFLPRGEPESYAAGIVGALKYPASAGAATGVLLDALHDIDPTAPGKEAGLAANLAWLKKAYRALDLVAPPECPPPPDQLDLVCPIPFT